MNAYQVVINLGIFSKVSYHFHFNLQGLCILRFTADQYIEKLKPEVVCSDEFSVENFITQQVVDYGNGADVIFKVQKLQEWFAESNSYSIGNTENKTFDFGVVFNEKCKQLVQQDIARISVNFESEKYVRTLTSKRVHFSETLGAFGKYSNSSRF